VRVGRVTSDWLTGVRFRRLAEVLKVVPGGGNTGLGRGSSVAVAWRTCGGPFDEIHLHYEVLEELALIRERGDALVRTSEGNRVVRALRTDDLTLLGIALIRAGYFFDQARLLIENGEVDDDQNLTCMRRVALGAAPQLVMILDLWPDVQTRPRLRVPRPLLNELDTVWSLLPPETEVPEWARERKGVGDRAEMYTVHYERTRVTNRSAVVWVARDTDSLGYDVEDRSQSPSRCIEVKGRRDREEIFFMSQNEMNRARELSGRYEVHFWGGIDLSRDPATEYSALRAEGYPLVIERLAVALDRGEWAAEPTRWRIVRPVSDA
jgi:hypothetical protein